MFLFLIPLFIIWWAVGIWWSFKLISLEEDKIDINMGILILGLGVFGPIITMAFFITKYGNKIIWRRK